MSKCDICDLYYYDPRLLNCCKDCWNEIMVNEEDKI